MTIDRATRAKLERIRGWGADADPANRPGVPKADPKAIPATHQEPPVWQRGANREIHPPDTLRTPVVGTSVPLKWLAPSGWVRRLAYRIPQDKSEHWVLLLVGDRLDVLETRLRPVFILAGLAGGAVFAYGALTAPAPRKRLAFR